MMIHQSNRAKLGVFTLVIMNVTAVVSLKGLPEEAGYGLSSAFYYLLAAFVFLIPTSLVAAELAAMFQDKAGGVFRWVGEAFGEHFGFMAIWLQWIQSVFWYLTTLTFGGVAIAFMGRNSGLDTALSNNAYYIYATILVLFWVATYIAMGGMGRLSKITRVGGLVGTIVPAALLIVLAIMYLSTGGKSQMDLTSRFVPDLSNFNNIVLAISIFSFYAGVGFVGSTSALCICFVPPTQLNIGNLSSWYAILISTCSILIAAHFIIYALRKKSWVYPSAQFAPFHWESKKQLPKFFEDELRK